MTQRAACLLPVLIAWSSFAWAQPYSLPVLPAEHKSTTDLKTGAEVTFLTTAPGHDTNLYFHERSWLNDSSMIIFMSDRASEDGQGMGLMGYLTTTGELVVFKTPGGYLSGATAAVNKPAVYALRGNDVVELTLDIKPADSDTVSSTVTAAERVLCALPAHEGTTSLNENCTGEWLAIGATRWEHMDGAGIVLINAASGKTRDLCKVGDPPVFAWHVQWSHTDPNYLSFAGLEPRLWVVDIRDGQPRNPYPQWPNELVTHEHWWVDDQIVFCGGLHPAPTEESHVKTVNIHTGMVRIIGAGAWWPDGTDEEIAKQNFWHCAGSDDGRWVVADNWHGDLTLFEGKTTRPRLLTQGHRTYGIGDHPEMGWDRKGRQVVFASHQLGDVNVAVATIPEHYQKENPTKAK